MNAQSRIPLEEIGEALGELLAKDYGQRPRLIRMDFEGKRLVASFGDLLAPVERSLIEEGRGWLVYEMQQRLPGRDLAGLRRQGAEMTGRRVLGQTSSFSLEPESCRLVFLLTPDPRDP